MKIARRDFLKGFAASLGFAALPGGAVFAAPAGWKARGKPKLVFGVVSDTHLRTRLVGIQPGRNWSPRYFAAAMEYFASRNVDAVVHCGDFAHRGQVEEMQYHANYWNKFFPGSRSPDGRRVEKLFITGNHDAEGSGYYGFCAKKYPDPAERAKHVLATDMAANWERIWGEKFELVWHKEVKGCHFFGRNWGADGEAFANLVDESSQALDSSRKPFFVLTHRRPLKALRNRLSRHPGGIAFFGHNHWSIANWNMVYDYGALKAIQCPSCEPRGCNALVGDAWITKTNIEGLPIAGRGRQGFVVNVYDEMLVIERHEFSEGEASMGADWVMPVGKSAATWSVKEELKKTVGAPQFRSGAKLKLSRTMAIVKNASSDREIEGDDEDGAKAQGASSPDAPQPCVRLSIPPADGNPDSRVYAYEIAAAGSSDGKRLRKAVYAAGCNLGIGREPDGGVTALDIPEPELPSGDILKFAVRPVSSLGTAGRAIAAVFKRNTLET